MEVSTKFSDDDGFELSVTGIEEALSPLQLDVIARGESTPEPKTDIEAMIRRRHPKYKDLKPHWEFLRETYEGGRAWFKSNIFPYHKEGKGEYEKRIRRAYRFNHTREVVDLVNKYLFKKLASRSESADPRLLAFWKRASKRGLDMNEFMRQVSRLSSMSGRIGIVVDKKKVPVGTSVAEGKKIVPYAYTVLPDQLLDYAYDEDDGELLWVLIYEQGRDDSDPLTSSGSIINRWRLWTRTDWTLYEETDNGFGGKEIVEVDGDNHDLGEVPVILHDDTIGDDQYESPSLIDDIAYLDRAVANYLSNLDAIIQDQTFSQLAMPAENVMPGQEEYDALVDAGTKRVFLYRGEGGGKPEYLSPDPKQADVILSVINKIINEIYHTVGLAGERTKEDNAMGIDNSSGVAKAYDFERVNALLGSKADSLESTENRIARLVLLWSGVKPGEEELVTYPESFDVKSLYDEFDIAKKLSEIQAPDTMRREHMNLIVDKMFPQMAKDVIDKMKSELKDWPKDPAEEAARQAELTAKATAPYAPKPATPAKPTKSRQGQVTKDTK